MDALRDPPLPVDEASLRAQDLPLSVLFAACWKDANSHDSDDDENDAAGEDLVLLCAGGRQVAASSLLLRVAAGPVLRARIRQACAAQHAAGGSNAQRSHKPGSNGSAHMSENGAGPLLQLRIAAPGRIDMHDDDAADWVLLLHHLYSGAMELTRQPPPISWGNVERLLRLSAKHDIKPTLRRCQAFLHGAIRPLQPPAGGAAGFPAAAGLGSSSGFDGSGHGGYGGSGSGSIGGGGGGGDGGGGGGGGDREGADAATLAAAASAWPAGATAVKWLGVFEELHMPELYKQQLDCLLAGLQHINVDKRASITLLAFLQAQACKQGDGNATAGGFSGFTASVVLSRVLGAFVGSVNAQVAAEECSGLKEKDLTTVMRQARVVRSEAVTALRAANGSTSTAIAALATKQRSSSTNSNSNSAAHAAGTQQRTPAPQQGPAMPRRATVSFSDHGGSDTGKGRCSPHRLRMPSLNKALEGAQAPAAGGAEAAEGPELAVAGGHGGKPLMKGWSKMLKKL